MNTPAYHLQKYNGPSTRYTCPSCGAKHRFTRYVDAYGRSLHPSVGRCDRESACGYHKTPRDYFAEHPTITRHAGLDPASPAVMPGPDADRHARLRPGISLAPRPLRSRRFLWFLTDVPTVRLPPVSRLHATFAHFFASLS